MKKIFLLAGLISALLGASGGRAGLAPIARALQGGPQLLGRALLGQANDVAVIGLTAYVATSSGLSIVDVSNPAKPNERGRLYLPDECLAVVVSQPQVYLVCGHGGLFIADASDLTRPRVVSHLNGRYAADMALVGRLGYLADADTLIILDLSEPDFPIVVGSVGLSGLARRVVISEGFAYVTLGEAGVELIDVSFPITPQPLATVDTPGEATGVAVSRNLVFIADGANLIVLNVSDPTQPRLLESFGVDGIIRDVRVEGETVYAIASFEAGTSQLFTISASNPSRLRLMGTVNFAGEAARLTVSVNRAYVAALCEGVMFLDLSRRDTPRLLGAYAEPSCFTEVAAYRTTVFVGRSLKDVAIVDASDAAEPRLVGTINGSAATVVGAQGLLAVADMTGITIYSLANPASPAQQGQLRFRDPVTIHTIAASGTLVAIGTSDSILLVDLSNPRRPTSRGTIAGPALKLAIEDQWLLAARGTDGLSVIDVSNPNRPQTVTQVASMDPLFGTTSVAASGGRVFLGEFFIGVRIFSLSSMARLSEIGRYEAPSPVGLIVKDPKLHIADQFRGLEMVDVTDPVRPSLISTFNPGGSITSLALEGNRIYLVDSRSGVWIVQP
jgi:hypothetical protein